MSVNVAIIDYDAGNLDSVKRAIERCGRSAFIAKEASSLKKASHIILPGVGVFSEGMQKLNKKGFTREIKKQAIDKEVPFLGICLGMQLLANKGTEGGDTEGLGLIKGKVIKLTQKQNERIPHIGWNQVIFKKQNPIFEGMDSEKDFYFVHSYHFVPTDKNDTAAVTPYCGEFISAVCHGNIFGVQFHPEKSQKNGFKILKNFLCLKPE